MSVRPHRAGGGFVAVVAVVAGCSSTTAGDARGTTAVVSTTTAGTTTSAAPSGAPSAAPLDIDPCELLTADEATSLLLPARGEFEVLVGMPTCDWQGDRGGMSIGVNDELGLDGLVYDDTTVVTELVISDHRAARAPDDGGPGYCSVAFAVGENANVSLIALYLKDPLRACEVADRAAQLVEPKLP